MTESAEPGPAPSGPTTVTHPDDGIPRLPDAVPAPTPTPEPAPDPHAAAATEELDEPAPPKQSKAPVGFFVFMLLIVGAIVAIAAIARPWESADDAGGVTSEEAPTASTAPATTVPATTVPATTVPATTAPATTAPVTTAPNTETVATTTLVVAPLPPTGTADAGPFEASAEACAIEQRTVEVAAEAFEALTGALPATADELVTAELLRPRPEGWSTRWTFTTTEGGFAVVPVAGGACDL